ncbi:TetR/AcrR family transcriptional regulator [Acetobacteraceae bacterium H6797]|nr:TetR/AcrR family transcriptional regulator [Acetobacteraceae bacterium H6797]
MDTGTLSPLDTTVSPKQRAALDAAARLFMARGYAAVSMDAVAKEAGISKATLYAHFASKDALFAAFVEERCRMLEADTQAVSHDVPVEEAVRRIGGFWLRFMITPGAIAVHRIVMAEGWRFPDLINAFYRSGPTRMKAWLAAWVAEEQRLGRLRNDVPPQEAAWHLASLMRGEVFMRVALGVQPPPSEADIEHTVESATRAFIRSYGAQGCAMGGAAGPDSPQG